jgi:hypothetical protein
MFRGTGDPARLRRQDDRRASLGLDCDVISAVHERRDLGVVPLVTQPLSVGESFAFGPRDKTPGGTDNTIALIGPGDADVGHAAYRQVADSHSERVGIEPGRQALEVRPPDLLLRPCRDSKRRELGSRPKELCPMDV